MSAKSNISFSEMEAKEQDEKLLEPFTYIVQLPGKMIYTKWVNAIDYWLKVPTDKFQAVGGITQLLHDSSLCIDDIQDNSFLRRGIPVAHAIYGVGRTIQASNHVLLLALERSMALNNPEATQIFTEQILELFRGQGIEIYWRDSYTCPTESEYRRMAIQKTGGLFNVPVRLMQLYSDFKEDLTYLTEIIGLYYQIRDDYCNLRMQEDYCKSKDYCEDLSEGKFSFLIVHAIHSQPEDKRVMNILRQRTNDVSVKMDCVNLLEKFGSFAYTRSVLKELDQSARNEIERLGGNPQLTAMLDALHNWTEIEENDLFSGRTRSL